MERFSGFDDENSFRQPSISGGFRLVVSHEVIAKHSSLAIATAPSHLVNIVISKHPNSPNITTFHCIDLGWAHRQLPCILIAGFKEYFIFSKFEMRVQQSNPKTIRLSMSQEYLANLREAFSIMFANRLNDIDV